jgi:2-phosphoglycerate kinase
MISVRKNNQTYPFSKGILARSISPSGLSLDESYSIVFEIRDELQEEGVETIDSDEIREHVSQKLLDKGYTDEEKHYRVLRQIAAIKKPIVILIAGATGVGKSSISAELAHRIGIERVTSTDTIREIMRYMMPKDLVPTLHASSFKADEFLQSSFIEDKLLAGFNEQVNLVSQGVQAFIQRGKKEGLKTILNGIHLVPGFLNLDSSDNSMLLFHYFLDLQNEEEHKHRFHYRSEGSYREPERYVRELDNIRKIQDHMRKAAKREHVKIIQNEDFEDTMQIIMQDIMSTIEEEIIHE